MTSYIIAFDHPFTIDHLAAMVGVRAMELSEQIIRVGDEEVSVYLRHPDRARSSPSLLIHLTMTGRQGLESFPFSHPADYAARHGHFVASFDLPNHGARIDSFGAGLDGMAAAIAAGHRVFDLVVRTGSLLIDLWTSEHSEHGSIIASGVSRGGLAALHLAAADARVTGIAAFAPVTDLRALREFAGLPNTSTLEASSAMALGPALVDRDVFISINECDERVNTRSCLDFYASIAPRIDGPVRYLRVDAGSGHSVPDAAYHEGSEWLIKRMNRTRW